MMPELLAEWKQIVKECKTTSMWEHKLAMLLIAVDDDLEELRAQLERLTHSLNGTQSAREWLEARDKAAYERGAKDAMRNVMQAVDEVGYYKP